MASIAEKNMLFSVITLLYIVMISEHMFVDE